MTSGAPGLRTCGLAAAGMILALGVSHDAALGADPFRRLKAVEIKSRLAGMELTDDVHWAYVFGPGGRLTSYTMGKAGAGRWRVEKDELCLDHDRNAPRCYEVWISAQKLELRHGRDLPEEGVLQKPRKRS